MIYLCPVDGCGVLHEMGSDHRDEPCLACWREGWRLDGMGNVYRVDDAERARGAHVPSAA